MDFKDFRFIEACSVEIKKQAFTKVVLYDLVSHSLYTAYSKFNEQIYSDLQSIPIGENVNDKVIFSCQNGKVKIKFSL